MKKLTIIDSYDYVVDFIENIVSIMNESLSKFGKYSLSNGEISKIIIEDICNEIKFEHIQNMKNITDHLLVPRKNSKETRKLAVEIDDKLIKLTNNTISLILGEGYKKIPSRTMFFRESLNVFYDLFVDKLLGDEEEKRRAMLKLYNAYAEKILGPNRDSKETDEWGWDGLGLDISAFIEEGFFGAPFWQSILDNYQIINKIIESKVLNLVDIKRITEKIFKFIDKVIDEDDSNPDIVTFTKNYKDQSLEMALELPKIKLNLYKSQLQNLIEIIEPAYSTINDKIKLYFLLSFIQKEFEEIRIKILFYFAPESQYIKKNAMGFSELYLMAEELTLANGKHLILVQDEKKKIKKLLVDIFNYDIQHSILVGSYFKDRIINEKTPYWSYSPIIFFLSTIFLAITSVLVATKNEFIVEDGIIILPLDIIKNLPQFNYKDNNKD